MPTNQMRPIHPGEILREEFIEPLHLDINSLAKALHIPVTEINAIVTEQYAVDARMALRLARYFATTPQFWLNLQIPGITCKYLRFFPHTCFANGFNIRRRCSRRSDHED